MNTSIKFVDFHSHTPQIHQDSDTFVLYCHADVTQELPSELSNQAYTAGLHPWFIPEDLTKFEDHWNRLQTLLENDSCLGLGECGLDRLKGPKFEIQIDVMKMQLELATLKSLPFIVVHCVRAYPECMSLIKASGFKGHIIFHDFGAKNEMAKQILSHEKTYLSLGAALERESFVSQVLPKLPLERVLLETDDAKNITVKERYRQLSQARTLELEEIKTTLYKNAQEILPVSL